MNAPSTAQSCTLRPLRRDDLDQLVGIDKAHTGNARRRFMEKRLAAAVASPVLGAQRSTAPSLKPFELDEVTIEQLQAGLASGRLSAVYA